MVMHSALKKNSGMKGLLTVYAMTLPFTSEK